MNESRNPDQWLINQAPKDWDAQTYVDAIKGMFATGIVKVKSMNGSGWDIEKVGVSFIRGRIFFVVGQASQTSGVTGEFSLIDPGFRDFYNVKWATKFIKREVEISQFEPLEIDMYHDCEFRTNFGFSQRHAVSRTMSKPIESAKPVNIPRYQAIKNMMKRRSEDAVSKLKARFIEPKLQCHAGLTGAGRARVRFIVGDAA